MGYTVSQIQSRVLREAQIPNDTSTASVTAQADILNYIDERAKDIWSRRRWREYLILGSFTVPAKTNVILFSSIVNDSSFAVQAGRGGFNPIFAEVISIRNGTTPLMVEDADAVQFIQADQWTNTSNPTSWVPLGTFGVYLLGQFSIATKLNFAGKAGWQGMATTDQFIIDDADMALVYGSTADLIRANDRDVNRSNVWEQRFNAEVLKLIDRAEAQAGNWKRIIPFAPWTDLQSTNQLDTSITGINLT